jgi:vacuolar-type H+-ATPase subunit H
MKLLAEIEAELLSQGTAIWSKRVDADKCLDLLSRVAQALPKTLDEAEVIIAEKNRILDSARIQARDILERADMQASEGVSMSSVKRRAETHALELRREAEHACEEIALENKAVLASMYEDFEKYLADMLNVTRRNKSLFAPKPERKAHTAPKRTHTAHTAGRRVK